MGHYVQNTGDTVLRFLEIFKSDRFEDVSLNQWLALTPQRFVEQTLNVSPAFARRLKKKNHRLSNGNTNSKGGKSRLLLSSDRIFIFIKRKSFAEHIMDVAYCNKGVRVNGSDDAFQKHNFVFRNDAVKNVPVFFVYDPCPFKTVTPRSISSMIFAGSNHFSKK